MFYTFIQNNSGGFFDSDDEVRQYVIIEGDTADEVIGRAKEVGIYFDGCQSGLDCSCCGDRWYEPYQDPTDEVPSIYGEPVTPAKENSDANVVIYYKDGTRSFGNYTYSYT